MTNTELLSKIKDFANEQKELLKGVELQSDFRRGEAAAYSAIISFLSTLESEHLANARKMSPKDLEEAAREFAKDAYPDKHNLVWMFKRGAKWQKQHDSELIEIAYNDGITIGMTKQKEQMMKEAVEGEVCIPNVWVEQKAGKELVVRAEISKELGFKFGEKVKIIIVKEEKNGTERA